MLLFYSTENCDYPPQMSFAFHAPMVSTCDVLLRNQFPNLLRQPPGLERLLVAPDYKNLMLTQQAEFKRVADNEDMDGKSSDCSTADISEAISSGDTTPEVGSVQVSPTSSTLAFNAYVKDVYCPGQVLQLMASGTLVQQASRLREVHSRTVLELDKVLPEGRTEEFPSIGSSKHHFGLCQPCDFMYRTECRAGYDCKFCHICQPGENRRRKKQKQALLRVARRTLKQKSDEVRSVTLMTSPANFAPRASATLSLATLL